jgi:septal ring factor EnvC (AmiA/AmiB activator)
MSSLSNNDLALNPEDFYDVAFSKLEKSINDNETITAAALNDLNNKINESDNQITESKSELIPEIDSKIYDVNDRLDNLGDLSITENYQLSDLVNDDLDI